MVHMRHRRKPQDDRKLTFAEAKAVLVRVARLFSPYKGRVALVAGLIVVSSGLGVVNPLLIRKILDDALFVEGGPDNGLLAWLIAIMIGIAAVASAVGVVYSYFATKVGQAVMRDLRDSLYTRLKAMPLRFFTQTRTGEIQSRLTNDVGGVDQVVTRVAQDSVANVVIVVSSLVAMLVMSWQLTILTVAVVPVFAWLTHRTGAAGHERWKKVQEAKADMTSTAEETLSVSGVLLSKVFGRHDDEVQRFREQNDLLTRLQVRARINGRIFWAVVGVFFAIAPASVFAVAAWQMSSGGQAITVGTIIAFTTLQARLFWPVGEMFWQAVEVRSSFAMFDRIFEYLDLETEVRDGHLELDGVRGRIRLEGARFTYPGASSPALDGVDLEIEPGQLAALVGPTGAGKTTLSYLVGRLYDVDEGAVTLDGHDVRDLRLASLARAIGMVTQETHLFHASVRANLEYGRPDATQEELEAAARAPFKHDRITELTDGYETVVGERGYRLSGGEKQRLSIARALLKDPAILVLDEATSALDTHSERIVQRALTPLMQGRTTLAIAHRLSTILAADVIFVLDRGRIVERGSHAELTASGGLYASLYEEQFSSGLVEARCEDGIVLSSGGVVRTAAQPT
jgi:ATP-binding cassette subfamily B protein